MNFYLKQLEQSVSDLTDKEKALAYLSDYVCCDTPFETYGIGLYKVMSPDLLNLLPKTKPPKLLYHAKEFHHDITHNRKFLSASNLKSTRHFARHLKHPVIFRLDNRYIDFCIHVPSIIEKVVTEKHIGYEVRLRKRIKNENEYIVVFSDRYKILKYSLEK